MATTQELKDQAFRELTGSPPARVKGAKRNQGPKAAQKIKTAMALDLARSRGAKIPRK